MKKYQIQCHECGKVYSLDLDPKDVERWRSGELAQVAFPYLDAGDRELLISHICNDCFDKLMNFETEED